MTTYVLWPFELFAYGIQQRHLIWKNDSPPARIPFFMARHFIQYSCMPHQRFAQSFRTNYISMGMGDPDLLNHYRYIQSFPPVFSGIELSLQMLSDLQVCTDRALNLGALSLTPIFFGPDPRLTRRASLAEYRSTRPNKNTEKRQGTTNNHNTNIHAHSALIYWLF